MSERKNQFDQPIGRAVPDWVERQSPRRAAILGRFCRLELAQVDRHARDLFAAYGEAPYTRDWTYLSSERPQTAEQFRIYLAELAQSKDPLHFAIRDLTTGKAAGTVALGPADTAHGAIEVSAIAYSPRLKRTRAGTETLYLLLRHAFDELGYRRCEWLCDSLDVAARAAADRLGFVAEGMCRDGAVYKGRTRDTTWFSMIAKDWPRHRAALERWLDPQNFDERGQQKHSLWAIRERRAARLSAGNPDESDNHAPGSQEPATRHRTNEDKILESERWSGPATAAGRSLATPGSRSEAGLE